MVFYDVSLKKLAGKLSGHTMPVISVDVASQNRIVSGSADGSVRLWTYKPKKID